MPNLKKKDGITMVALMSMIIVILILAGVSLTEGTKLVKKTKVENIMTNMITIRANAKVYAEEINAEIWDVSEEEKSTQRNTLYFEEYKMSEPSNAAELIAKVDSNINDENGCECYEITKDTLSIMGLDELVEETNNGDYIVVYNAKDYTKLEIIYQPGIQYNETTYYTLSSIQSQLEE